MKHTAAPTIADLRAATTPQIPHLVGGEIRAGHYSDIPQVLINRLLLWAAITAQDPGCRVVVTNTVQVNGRGRQSDLRFLADQVIHDDHPRHAPMTAAWTIELHSPCDRETITLDLTRHGAVVGVATPSQDAAAAAHRSAVSVEDSRRAREEAGHGLRDAVRRATLARQRARRALDEADAEWTTAIRAVFDPTGRPLEQISDVARLAEITPARVYQIHKAGK